MPRRAAGLLVLAALLLLAPSTQLSAALESAPGGAAPRAGDVAIKSVPAATAEQQSPATATTAGTSTSSSPSRSSDTAAARAGAAHNTAATDALFFFAFMLLIGIFTVHVLAFTRVPYTALLLVSKTRKREKERRGNKRRRKAFFSSSHLFSFPSLSVENHLKQTNRSGASSSASPSRPLQASGPCCQPEPASGRA